MTTAHKTIPWSLSEAICAEGIPSMAVGLTAATQRLATMGSGEGQPHFEWDIQALNKRSVAFLEHLLLTLRIAAKAQP